MAAFAREQSEELMTPLVSRTTSLPTAFGEGSIASSVVLLCGAAIGAGVLALPYGVSRVGILPAMLLFALAGVAAHISNVILFRCVHKTGLGSYGELMVGIMGRKGAMILDLLIFVEGLGAVATYLCLIMDFVPQVCALAGDEDSWCMSRTNVITAASVVIWPLSCLRGLSALRYTSTCSMLSLIFTSIVVILKSPGRFAETGRSLSEALQETKVGLDAFQVLTMACFAFMTHTNTPEIAMKLRAPSRRRFSKVVGTETFLMWAVYCSIAVCGFVSFFEKTRPDFLTNYEVRDPLVILCRVFLSVNLVFACPLNSFPAVQSLFNIMEGFRSNGLKDTLLYDVDIVRVPVTTLCYAGTVYMAVRTPTVADLISVVCAFFSSPLMFAFPALMYWRILGRRDYMLPLSLIVLTVALWVAETLRLVLPAGAEGEA